MTLFLGIDSSTTATKALLIRADGQVVGVASSEYAYETPRPMWTEQHPDLWWRGTVDSIRQVLADSEVDPADIYIGMTVEIVFKDNSERKGSINDIAYFRPV